MTLALGQMLGAYQVVEYLGKGGMAQVYKGYQPALDRFVAIKVLPDFFIDDAASLERFSQEARTIARLNHMNIVRVFDFGQADGTTYLILEFVEGGTLADRVGKQMPLEEVVQVLSPIASALDYAHTLGLLHRDIKPSNILVRKDGVPMLTDFGLATMMDSVRKITAEGTVMGTPDYMSPEQVSGEQIGPASDNYALAVVAYELLTGRVPFQAETTAAILMAHLNKAMPPTPELTGELSAHLQDALRRGLAKSPGDRFPSATDLIVALKPAAWPNSKAESVAGPDSPPTRRVKKRQEVLVVDDSFANRELIEACLAGIDCSVRMAGDGAAALKAIQDIPPDLVLLDVQMPGMNGYEVCRQIKSTPDGRLLAVVMITGLGSVADRVLALESGADDFMSKPVERTELQARVRSALRLKSVYDSLDDAQRVIFALAAAVEAKDSYTELHTQRVADMARMLGSRLGLDEEDLDALYRGALIHDIGKIGIPDAILLKPGPLTPDEEKAMREHPAIGERIVRPLHTGSSLLEVIRHHHERIDGEGYPDRLAGESIPIAARIVAVCDAHDALISDRPYRKRRPEAEALAILYSGAGSQWDKEVVDHLLRELPEAGQAAS
jgi:putative two-component system response regulator